MKLRPIRSVIIFSGNVINRCGYFVFIAAVRDGQAHCPKFVKIMFAAVSAVTAGKLIVPIVMTAETQNKTGTPCEA